MRTVFFVDDDILTLNKLRGIIDWCARGYAVAGQAMDGEAALRHIRALKPDLVLLDVHLPRMDGVAVAKEVHEAAPATRILILSNHDTFEYVRQAMKYGVYDYLLKHELTAVLLHQKLDELEALSEQALLSVQRDLWFAGIAKQQYLQDVALGKPLPESQHALMRAQPEFSAGYGVPAVARIVNLALFTCFDGESERQRLITSMDTLAQNVFSTTGNGLLASLGNGRFVSFFAFDERAEPEDAQSRARTAMQRLASNALRMLNITVLFHVCDPVREIRLLPERCEAAERHLDAIYREQAAAVIAIQDERELMDALSAKDVARTGHALQRIFDRYGQGAIAPLLDISRRLAHSLGIALSDVYLRQFQNAFRSPISFEQQAGLLTEHYRTLLSQAAAASIQHHSPYIRGAIAYIHDNYARDISLVTAAEHVGISAPYLSRQFPKEVGISFVEYLTEYRIEAAKRLLKQPGSKIKDVCRQAGFLNYNYFLRVFKKKTGFTVTQNAADTDGQKDRNDEG